MRTLHKFYSRERIWKKSDFFGCHVTSRSYREFSLSQLAYFSAIKSFSEDESFQQFRSVISELLWARQARFDIACAADRASHATKEVRFEVHPDYIELLNSAINSVKKKALRTLFRKLQEFFLHLRAYVHASFGRNVDLSSQLGYVILLGDKTNQSHVLDFANLTCKRVTKRILGGEFYRLQKDLTVHL